MAGLLSGFLKGEGLGARLIRSTGWAAVGYSASQFIRLASNLVLTRLLFPEAFGLMAIITVFLTGLIMLSDIGISPTIQQSPRGDDPDFVDTAWTMQVLRGVFLWLACIPLSLFAAAVYGEDILVWMLPVAGLSLLFNGFNPTRIDTASRHLALGRVTMLDLVAQCLALIVMLYLAWVLQSVWALVIGGVAGAALKLVVMHVFLPGAKNTFRWEKTAASELFKFGKWIFLSTLCGFVLVQGDKAILGKYLSLENLGIYNIGFFLAGFPMALASNVMARVMIPLYRQSPPSESQDNFARLRRTRFALTGLVFALQFTLAFLGTWLVDFLYDPRFLAAGSVVVAIACMQVPHLIGMTYDYAALGAGDSKGVFWLLLAKATLQIGLFLVGIEQAGLPGALLGIWVSQLLVHPLVAWLGWRHGAWDPWHDLFYGVVGLLLTASVLWLQSDAWTVLQSF